MTGAQEAAVEVMAAGVVVIVVVAAAAGAAEDSVVAAAGAAEAVAEGDRTTFVKTNNQISPLFPWYIRRTHISQTNIFTISFDEQAHIVSGIYDLIGRIHQLEIANLNDLVPVIRRKNFIGLK